MSDNIIKRRVSRDKLHKLKSSISYLRNVIFAVEEVMNGVPESYVCSKYNMSKSSFRKLIFNDKLGYKGVRPESIGHYVMSPAEIMYCDIFNVKDESYLDIPHDIEETVQEVMSNLDTRSQTILRLRYYDDKTFEEIGKELDISGSRVAIIHRNILNILADPCNAYILKYGREYRNKVEELRKIKTEEVRSKQIESLEANCNMAIRKNDVEAVRECYFQCSQYLKDNDIMSIKASDISIKVLGLSTRTYNCLQRANILTLEDLSKVTIEDIKQIREIGNRSISEIRRKLNMFGLVDSLGEICIDASNPTILKRLWQIQLSLMSNKDKGKDKG